MGKAGKKSPKQGGRSSSCPCPDSEPLLEAAEQAVNMGPGHSKLAVAACVGKLFLLVVKKFWALSTTMLLILLLLYWMYGGLVTLSMLVIAILGLLYNAQDVLLYYPDQPPHSRIYVESPSTLGLPFENIFIQTRDKVRINMILIKQPPPLMGTAHTIIVFHGNAGNIGHRLPNCYALQTYLRANILLVEYRGYGKSGGKPSEQGFYNDSAAAMDYIFKRSDINQSKLVVFGRSLGGAVAVQLCSVAYYASRIQCLIVENTFTSLPAIGRHLFDLKLIKILPNICFKNKYPSNKRIQQLSVPTLFLSGSADTLIPPSMMQQLYEMSGSELKRLAKFEGGTHNETWQCPGYYESINRFFAEVEQSKRETPPKTAGTYSVDIPFDDGGATFTL